MILQPIKDHPDFVKDKDSKAILNTNFKMLEERRRQKAIEKEISDLRSDVTVLKSEMTEIKQLLQILINSNKQ